MIRTDQWTSAAQQVAFAVIPLCLVACGSQSSTQPSNSSGVSPGSTSGNSSNVSMVASTGIATTTSTSIVTLTTTLADGGVTSTTSTTTITGTTTTTGSTSSTTTSASSSSSTTLAGGSDAGSTCPATFKTIGDTTQTIMSGGISRTFVVHIPTGYTGTSPLPVVMDFHALGSTGSGEEGLSHWNTKCDSVGCIAVFPNSSTNDDSWNSGFCCSNSEKNKVDDVQFTRDIIKWLEANTCMNPKKVYGTGCSNGGGMAYMVACYAADVFAAVAPVDFDCLTGGTATATTCSCTLARPISVTAFRATGDGLVPYNGGTDMIAATCPPGGTCTDVNFLGAPKTFALWAGSSFDSCTGSAATNANNSSCQTYSSCSGGAEVTLCTQQGGSHCGNYGSLHIVDTSWTMFQNESL